MQNSVYKTFHTDGFEYLQKIQGNEKYIVQNKTSDFRDYYYA